MKYSDCKIKINSVYIDNYLTLVCLMKYFLFDASNL